MKKKFAVWFLSLALLLPLLPTAQAASTTTYNYAVEGGNLKFDPTTGTIVGCDYGVYSADIPGEIYGVPVTAIRDNAFYGRSKLASVTIPTTVTTIGSQAFSGCSALKSIVIPSSVTTLKEANSTWGIFSNCKSLESVTIPGTIKRLPKRMFSLCSSLKTVNLGDGVEEIGRDAFGNCTSLESITLPDSVKSIESRAFEYCTNLRTATIGTGIKNISNEAFYNTQRLESLYFRGNAPSATSRMINKFADGFIIYYPAGATGWTTPTWNGYITRSYSPTPSQPTMVTAKPTASTVYVNGTVVAFDAYNINNNNYFKLRDLAFILSGSKAQFEVEWDSAANAIKLTSGRPYTPVGGEMVGKGAINKVGKLTKSAVYLDGKQVSFTAYNIDNNNYFKLRDIGQALDFSVEWNGMRQSIEIDTSLPYRPE
jgi:hypothetical protein